MDLVFDRKCACGQAVVRALAAHGGHAAARYLTELLRRGDFGLRWAVIESIGTPKGPLVGVVGVALDDPDLAVACAAAKAL